MKLTEWKYVDKLQHFGIMAGIAAVALALGAPWQFVLGASTVIASGKEFYDSRHPDSHTVDPWDAVWTVLGGLYAIGAAAVLC